MSLDLIYRSYESEPTFRDAEDWAKKFFEKIQEEESVESEAIYDLARNKYTQLINAKEVVEKKATQIIVFVMTATTVLSTGIPHGIMFHASLVLVGVAVLSSLMVLFPTDWPSLLSVRDALESCDYDQNKQQSQLSASIHVSIVGARLIVDAKSKWLACAYMTAIAGTAILTILRIYQPV